MACILIIVAPRPFFSIQDVLPPIQRHFPSVIDVTYFSVQCEDNQDIIYVGC